MTRHAFNFRRFWAIVVKEFIQMRRDRLTFGMMVGIPLLQLILFGYAINLNPNEATWYTTRGTAYLSLRDREKAYNDFRKACDLGDAEGCNALQ